MNIPSSKIMIGLNLLLCLFLSLSAHARQADDDYLKWKAQQTAQDARLKPKVDANYYLARPTEQGSGTGQTAVATGNKVNVNTATVEQLQQLVGVGAKKAQAIVDYRQKNGKIKNSTDLEQVKGIGPKLIEKNRNLLIF